LNDEDPFWLSRNVYYTIIAISNIFRIPKEDIFWATEEGVISMVANQHFGIGIYILEERPQLAYGHAFR